jgi:predicted TIM-barrel fold metal-dependent hydrolase
MAMGSDYPHKLGNITRAVTTIDAMDVSGPERDRIFSGTARAIINNP